LIANTGEGPATRNSAAAPTPVSRFALILVSGVPRPGMVEGGPPMAGERDLQAAAERRGVRMAS